MIDVALSIEAEGWAAVPDCEALVERALAEAARGVEDPLMDGAEVSVLLCDDATIRRLNATWRRTDKATNVLSFPTVTTLPLADRSLLGDIAVAWETTAAEAEHDDKPVADHLSHLVVHGFLHLVGLDHETEAEAVAMEALETRILAQLGIANPHVGELALEPDRS